MQEIPDDFIPTLLQTVKTALARGETVLVTELIDEWRDDENQIEEAVTFLRQQAAQGTILRIFPREQYVAVHAAEAYLHYSLVRMGDRLYEFELSDFLNRTERSELEKLFRCDWGRIHIHARDI